MINVGQSVVRRGRDVTIMAGAINKAFSREGRAMLFDPERPTVDPDRLLSETYRGKMLDPRLVNHNCPICKKTMNYQLFVEHMRPCLRRWYKTLDPTNRRFAGASL